MQTFIKFAAKKTREKPKVDLSIFAPDLVDRRKQSLAFYAVVEAVIKKHFPSLQIVEKETGVVRLNDPMGFFKTAHDTVELEGHLRQAAKLPHVAVRIATRPLSREVEGGFSASSLDF